MIARLILMVLVLAAALYAFSFVFSDETRLKILKVAAKIFVAVFGAAALIGLIVVLARAI
jgi:hypothetical protein